MQRPATLAVAVGFLWFLKPVGKVRGLDEDDKGRVTFVTVFLQLGGSQAGRGAERGAAHLHITVHICLLSNFGIKADFLPAFRRRDFGGDSAFAARMLEIE